MGFTQGYWGIWQKSFPNHFQSFTRGPGGWKSANVTPINKQGWKEELQACPSARECCGSDNPEWHHVAREGQPRDQAQPPWVHSRQLLLDQPGLQWQGGPLYGWGKGCRCCLSVVDCSKAFDTVSHRILLRNWLYVAWDGCADGWVANCRDAGPRECWRMELNPADGQSGVVFPWAQHWCQSNICLICFICLISSTTWLEDQRHPEPVCRWCSIGLGCWSAGGQEGFAEGFGQAG